MKHFSERKTEDPDASDTPDDDTVHRAFCLFGRLIQVEVAKSAAKSIDAISDKEYVYSDI